MTRFNKTNSHYFLVSFTTYHFILVESFYLNSNFLFAIVNSYFITVITTNHCFAVSSLLQKNTPQLSSDRNNTVRSHEKSSLIQFDPHRTYSSSFIDSRMIEKVDPFVAFWKYYFNKTALFENR